MVIMNRIRDSVINARRMARSGAFLGMLETISEAVVVKTNKSTSVDPSMVAPLMNGVYPIPPKRVGEDNQSGIAISIDPCAPLQNARKKEMNALELTPTPSVVSKLVFGSSAVASAPSDSGDVPTLRRTFWAVVGNPFSGANVPPFEGVVATNARVSSTACASVDLEGTMSDASS